MILLYIAIKPSHLHSLTESLPHLHIVFLSSLTPSPSPDHPVTEDMCVIHFLIQPDPEGVKLQGWNERSFSEEGRREGRREGRVKED